MNEIVKLVTEKNRERKVLNKNDINEICNVIKSKNEYCKDFNIRFEKQNPYNDDTCGTYFGKTVTIYTDNLKKGQEVLYEALSDIGILDGCRVDAFNFATLNVIFHEFVHAEQQNAIRNGRGNIDSKLFDICNKLRTIKDFYNDNYNFFISEVNAYSKSFLNAYNIYNKLPKELVTSYDKSIYATYLINVLKSSYYIDYKNEMVVSPSEILMEMANYYNTSKFEIDINKFRNLVNGENKLTLYKKLILGLPITYMEYAYLVSLESSVKDVEDINFVHKLQKRI